MPGVTMPLKIFGPMSLLSFLHRSAIQPGSRSTRLLVVVLVDEMIKPLPGRRTTVPVIETSWRSKSIGPAERTGLAEAGRPWRA